MQAGDYTTTERNAFDHGSWSAFQAAIFVGGGSILLWSLILSLVNWLI